MTTARWGAWLVLALILGGWSGSVVGAPPGGVVAQAGGTSSSGASGGGDSGSSGGGDSGSSGSGGGGDGSDGGGTGDGSGGTGGGDGTGTDGGATGDGFGTAGGSGDGGSGTGDGGQAAPTTAPPDVPEEAIADGEETECGAGGTADGQRCYQVQQVDGVEAVRVPDGQGGTRIVAIGDAPQVNIDSGASTSASSNVDVRVDVDVDTGDVIRVERRVDPVRQFALITIAALLGVFVGAAVLGTFLRFRNGPKSAT